MQLPSPIPGTAPGLSASGQACISWSDAPRSNPEGVCANSLHQSQIRGAAHNARAQQATATIPVFRVKRSLGNLNRMVSCRKPSKYVNEGYEIPPVGSKTTGGNLPKSNQPIAPSRYASRFGHRCGFAVRCTFPRIWTRISRRLHRSDFASTRWAMHPPRDDCVFGCPDARR